MARKLKSEDLLRVVRVAAPKISPDGRWVVYQISRMLMDENKYSYALWAVPTDGSSPPEQLIEYEPTANSWVSLRATWSPDSKTITCFPPGAGLVLMTFDDGEITETRSPSESNPAFNDSAGMITNISWAPDGQRIAFISSKAPEQQEPPMTAVEIDVLKGASLAAQAPNPTAFLAVLDVVDGSVDQLTDESMEVRSFGWSPDSGRLVFAARQLDKGRTHYLGTDLFIIDLDSRDVQTLLDQPGGDIGPVWSPDGKSIAFWSQMGSEEWGWHYIATPAVIPVEGGEPTYPIKHLLNEFDTMYYENDFIWSADCKRLFFESSHHLTHGLFSIAVEGGPLERLTPDDGVFYSGFSLGNGKMAFARETVTEPADIYVSSSEKFEPLKLSNANPQFEDLAAPSIERLTWESADRKWDINGYLILPVDYEEGKKYPLLVEIVGGPSMTSMKFTNYMPFPNLLFAAQGYAILVPNTRGRGGYGERFRRAIEDERSFLLNPLGDMMPGVDLVVERGIADPERIGIMGHSYGGAFTAMTITKTDRFAAAAFHEGVSDFVYHLLKMGGDPVFRDHQRQQGGMAPPYDPEELEHVIRESPIYEVRNVKTPTLIEAGEQALHEHATLLANGLEFFGVPFEYYLYPRTGHVTTEPQLIADEFQRKLDWFGYWLQDKPYSNPEKQEAYNEWKTRAPAN